MSEKSGNIIEFPFDVENMLRLLQAEARQVPDEKTRKALPEIAVRITVGETEDGAGFVLHRLERKPGSQRFVQVDRRAENMVSVNDPRELWQSLMAIFKTGKSWKTLRENIDELP